MKRIILKKAEPLTDRSKPVEDVVIEITGKLPSSRTIPLDDALALYKEEAERLVDAITAAMPQGTVHQVLIRLLKEYPSYYMGAREECEVKG
jgi:hypothetical protein